MGDTAGFMGIMIYRWVTWVLLLFSCLLLSRFFILAQLRDINRAYHQWTPDPTSSRFIVPEAGVRDDKFLEVPQIVWGLNNQKIALARAALTARKLNRTLLMPNLSASLFYKETDLLEPLGFDHLFSVHRFNSLCNGFARISSMNSGNFSDVFVVAKGNGRRWTAERDMAQLEECKTPEIDRHTVIKLEGKHPFLWHDHWPVLDYARVFECLVLVHNLSAEVSRVVSKLRRLNSPTGIDQNKIRMSPFMFQPKYVAVHMRIEKDWMIHCKKLEMRSKARNGKNLRICSSKEEIMKRVANIPGLEKPSVVYLAVADDLLEDRALLEGWSGFLTPYEKKKLGVLDIYSKYPYLIQSAIDYEICLQADTFVGNSFSTFSSLIVLQRTMRMDRARDCEGSTMASYAYNIEGSAGGPKRWATNMSDLSLAAISYGSNEVSCQ